jgi:hypothetical protein
LPEDVGVAKERGVRKSSSGGSEEKKVLPWENRNKRGTKE